MSLLIFSQGTEIVPHFHVLAYLQSRDQTDRGGHILVELVYVVGISTSAAGLPNNLDACALHCTLKMSTCTRGGRKVEGWDGSRGGGGGMFPYVVEVQERGP